jgi:hypothetical protein
MPKRLVSSGAARWVRVWQDPVVQPGLAVEVVVALGQAAQGVAGRVGRSAHRVVAQCPAHLDELEITEWFELFAQVRRCGDDNGLQRDDRLGACLHGGVLRDFDLADHLHRAVSGFRDRGRGAGQHRPGRCLGIERVVLTVQVPAAPVRAVDLDDLVASPAQKRRQPGTVEAGPLDPETDLITMLVRQRSSCS